MVVKIYSQQKPAVGVTVTTRRSALRWCLILSIIVHGLVLCILIFLPRREMRGSSLVMAVLAPSFPEETTPVEPKTFNEKAERPLSVTTRRLRPQKADGRAATETKPSLPDSPSLGRESSSSPARAMPGRTQESLGPGETASESGGVDIGGAPGSPSGKDPPQVARDLLLTLQLVKKPGVDSMIQAATAVRQERGLVAERFSRPFPLFLLRFRPKSFAGYLSRSARFTLKSIVMFSMDTICGTVSAYQPMRFVWRETCCGRERRQPSSEP